MPVPWGAVPDQNRPTALPRFFVLLFCQVGWALLVSTVCRTSRARAKRDVAFLLSGSEASERREPALAKGTSVHELALMVWFRQEQEGSGVLAW